MNKQYTKSSKKQSKKQQTNKVQSGGFTKLKKAHSERGFREKSTNIEFYGLLEDQQGKLHVQDYTAKYRTQATQFFIEEGNLKGWKLKEVRAYQK